MTKIDTTAGPGSDLIWANFYGQFDLTAHHRVFTPDNPGTLGGHALDDTITLTRHGTALVSNFRDLVLDEAGVVTGGTLTALYVVQDGVVVSEVTRLQASATDLFAAAQTPTGADDQMLWMAQLGQRDVFDLSAFDDTAAGFAGDDILHGNDGADDLYGGQGDDRVYGGTGNDRLFGEDGNDHIHGGAGDDTLSGGAHSTMGDTLSGGAGADHYVFDTMSGNITVTHFQKGQDKLVIDTGAQSIDDLLIFRSFNETVISIGSVSIHLDFFNGDRLDASDFIFV